MARTFHVNVKRTVYRAAKTKKDISIYAFMIRDHQADKIGRVQVFLFGNPVQRDHGRVLAADSGFQIRYSGAVNPL